MKQINLNEKQKRDFNEIHLDQLKQRLEELNQQLNQPENIFIQQKSNSFISPISIRFTSQSEFHLF